MKPSLFREPAKRSFFARRVLRWTRFALRHFGTSVSLWAILVAVTAQRTEGATRLLLSPAKVAASQVFTVPLELDATGQERAIGASLSFDPSRLTLLGIQTAEGLEFTLNTNQVGSGRVGFLVSFPLSAPSQTFSAGRQGLVELQFQAKGPAGFTQVSFGDIPVLRQVVDPSGNAVPASYVDATLEITTLLPPQILRQPSDVSTSLGSAVDFSVEVQGNVPLQFQWFRNETALPQATDSSLHLATVRQTDAGDYWVRVTNASGSSSSRRARLTVIEALAWEVEPDSQTVLAGESVRLLARAQAEPPPTYRWYRNGLLLTSATGPELNLPSINPNAVGDYYAVATHSAGSLTSRIAHVQLTSEPRRLQVVTTEVPERGVAAVPVVLSALGGEQALSFSVTFDPRLELRGVRVDHGTLFTNLSALGSGKLGLIYSLPPGEVFAPGPRPIVWLDLAVPSTAASYAVALGETPLPLQAVDAFGQPRTLTPSAGSVMVLALPRITQQPQSVAIQSPNAALFSVSAIGAAPLTYQWFVNGQPIPQAIQRTLQVSSQEAVIGGRYSVRVTNRAGATISAEAILSSGRFLAVGHAAGTVGTAVELPISLDTLGNEGAVSFSVSFDSRTLTFLGARPGRDAASANWLVNDTQAAAGRLGIAIAHATGTSWTAGHQELAVLRFTSVVPNEGIPVQLTKEVVPMEIADLQARHVDFQIAAGSVGFRSDGPECAPISGGLVGWWRGEGNALDQLGTSDGSLVGGGTASGSGKVGAAFSFNGSTALVSIADTPTVSVHTAMSLSAWIQLESITGIHQIARQYQSALNQTSWELYVRPDGTLFFGVYPHRDSSGVRRRTVRPVIRTHEWIQVTATFETAGGDMRIYVNGQPAEVESGGIENPGFAEIQDSTIPIELGVLFPGSLDEVMLFNRVLKPGEVAAIYAAGSTGVCPPGEPPSFVGAIGDVRVKENAPALFSVEVRGTPPWNYQWYHNGHQVPGATEATLHLPFAQRSDEGAYTVEVQNAWGRSLSSAGNLEVLIPPVIIRDPDPLRVRAGEVAEFSVEALGTPPLSFEWRRNGIPWGAENAPTIRMPTGASADSGFISVRIANTAGAITSAVVQLNVVEPISLVRVPPSLIRVDLQDGLELRVEASGSSPISYQWRLNGQDLPGETGSILRIPNVGLSHAGTYTVVVFNDAGALTTPPTEVRLNLPEAPGNDQWANATALTAITNRIQGNNELATHETNERDHADKPGVHSVWYRWLATESGRATLRTTGSSFDTLLAVYTGSNFGALQETASNDDNRRGGFFTSEVTFNAVAGTTYFVAVDGLGNASGNYILSGEFTALAPRVPQITQQPVSQTQELGRPVKLEVTANNADSVSWEFHGRKVGFGSSLILASLGPAQVGTYVAVVQGGNEVVESHPAVIEIGSQPGVRSYDKPEELDGPQTSSRQIERQFDSKPPLIVSPGRPPDQWVDNSDNTTQAQEPLHCGQVFYRTGILKLQPTSNGHLVITATNTTVPVLMALYAYPDLGHAVVCEAGMELRLTNAVAGKLYRLVFGSAHTNGGLIHLVWALGTPIPAAITNAPPTSQEIRTGEPVRLQAPDLGSLNPPPLYQWYRDGHPLPGATDRELLLSQFDSSLAGRYSVLADNGINHSEFLVADLAADIPLGLPDNGEGLRQGRFQLTGNPGQRIAVNLGGDLGNWTIQEEFWLPAGGKEYLDTEFDHHLRWFFGYREIPLTVVPESPLRDGRRTWRVYGGRLGKAYWLQRSIDGGQWENVVKNQVQEGSYLHVEPSSASPNVQLRALDATP